MNNIEAVSVTSHAQSGKISSGSEVLFRDTINLKLVDHLHQVNTNQHSMCSARMRLLCELASCYIYKYRLFIVLGGLTVKLL
jgi:hypothetical protein